MEIFLNGEQLETQTTTLLAFIEERQINTRGVAVAIGSRIVRRDDWKTTPLTEGVTITIIRATQGG